MFKSDLSLPVYEETDEKPVNGFLWWGVCYDIGIEDLLSKQASFCEYTQEIVASMMMIGEKHSGPDIWLETID